MDKALLLLGVVFMISSITIFALQKKERDVVFARFNLKRRRNSGSRTPLWLFSPGRHRAHGVPAPDYSTTFPPSRRHVLGESKDTLQGYNECLIPLETSYHNAADDLRTPCNFSVAEIKALGDFPDYAALSGVPLPKPYHEFDIQKALPRPYRPFRWAYHQTMSIAKMEPDWWLELENTYEERMKQRSQLFARYGDAVLQALPGSELACKELMETALQFLCARYPQYFSLNTSKTVLLNAILKTETELRQTPPLHVILQNIPEDFAIMLRDEKTGHYVFRAGIICSALGWNVSTKIGLQLHEIHASIPDYNEKMRFSMDRYFARMATNKPIQRGSWGLEVDQPLFMPPGNPHEAQRGYQMPDLELARCHLRVDWQTLRRLPLSGAVLFNFKALFTPVEDFIDEPYVPRLLLKVLNDGKKNLMDYKNAWHTEHAVKPALEIFHKKQVERGIVQKGWEPKTLDESPWFPAWEEKWHRQQGF
ncbi:hypothetical protein EKO04_010374 [Ascochyta lentis]|uniref:Alpha-1,2-mannosyltransferase n=1 Tax=Ascochyta lentis TaxID=205686 RepID=A0A8H7IVW9_9PLEO|nr:hypothetical protein EKO04_010374 [Ascochyta lentis]